ncbi:MAG: methylenetetrahydrofolate--tRNA-(uracil(54)-C(5))-methyltransferase (FADH(2)-oxidizing) TrmFO [Pseudomonadota bacterium]
MFQPASIAHHDVTARPVHVIGAGLAGSEAAWQLISAGIPVVLHEMRPQVATPAHKTGEFAELVCSNSFRSDDAETNAVGVLHAEMRLAGSLIMAMGDAHKLPAGGALAVDREAFASAVTRMLRDHPLVTVQDGPVDTLPPQDWDNVIVATGPLTSPGLSAAVLNLTGQDNLAFFDAIAPIVHRDSVDMSVAWMQSRYDKVGPSGTGADYMNCPMDEAQYNGFIDALLAGDTLDFKAWEADTPYFNGCLPIEVMAARGRETLRHGPMKPMGLTNAHQPDVKPYAVVQLRQDNALGTLWNIVGFQTKMRYGAQADVLRMIPGLERAEFARLGGMHRNTFLNSPKVLDDQLRLRAAPRLRFAGQITGVEGYVESASVGLLAGRMAAAERHGHAFTPPPTTTALGALLAHITGGHLLDEDGNEEPATAGNRPGSFQPMNVNFGLFPEIAITKPEGVKRWRGKEKSVARKRALSARALTDCAAWLDGNGPGSEQGQAVEPATGHAQQDTAPAQITPGIAAE